MNEAIDTQPYQTVVIMGDLVASRQAGSTQKVHKAFNRSVEAMNKAYEEGLISPLTITLGDEFQGLINSFSGAFSLVRAMRLLLLRENVRCRFVIGGASIETPVNREKAWNMMGPGLAEARELLGVRDQNAYRFSVLEQPVLGRLLNTLGAVLTDIEQEWTARQRELAIDYFYGVGESVADISAKYDVSETNVHKVLRAAGRDQIERVQSSIAETMKYLDGDERK